VKPASERRMLQVAITIACIVPIATGADGVLRGAALLRGMPRPVPPDVDSHFRYLSGVFLIVGLAFASCVAGIESKGARFRLLGAMVLTGGAARLASVLIAGWPSWPHRFGLAMELGVVPLLMLWQARVARQSASVQFDA